VVALALSRPLSEEWDPQARLSEFGNHVMALVTGLIDDGDSPGAGDGPLEPSDLATETPVEEERAALRSADETVAASTPEPAPIPAAEVRTEIPEDSAGPGNLAGPSDAEKETPAGQPLTEAQAGAPGEAPRDWPEDERLDRARVLLDQGYITYPPGGNAVALLVDVLEDHPGHPRAMDMLDESTVRLIEAARQARARGLDYEARNSLEEVLGFNPDNATANRLWREWIGEDR